MGAINDNNLAVLSSRYGINAMVNFFNGELGEQGLSNLVISDFYNNYLLDSMELAASNYIFQEYAKPYYVPEGYEKKKLKRYGSLTEHTTPLPEGIPPKSDKTMVESFEATYNTYGRVMEFTDRVNYMTIDPIIAMYSEKYGQLAARTKERLARNEMLHSTSILVPADAGGNPGSNAADLSHIMLKDKLGFNDYRVQVAKMKRMLVEPVSGNNFDLIGSPEVKFDLITDPMVRDYYGSDKGISAYADNTLPVLFNIQFRETMLDDYAFGYELANPGELFTYNAANNTTTYICRIYAKTPATTSSGVVTYTEYYFNVPESYRSVIEARLSDGSYIPEKVEWDIAGFLGDITTSTKVDSCVVSHTIATGATSYSVTIDGPISSTSADPNSVAKLQGYTWYQIPIHKVLLVGKDALIETGIEGHTAPKLYVKPLGSAGVLDPIDQRQSIGFKIDTIGYSLLKPEACVVGYTIPSTAEEINTTMYTYNFSSAYDGKVGQTQMNHHSYDIPGKTYVQTQTREGYNQYGKLNKLTGNVDTDRNGVPGVQAPFYNDLDEFGEVPTRYNGSGMTDEIVTVASGTYYPADITSATFVTDGSLYTRSGTTFTAVSSGSYSATTVYYKKKA